MHKLKIVEISPKIPEKLRFLEELSKNMWWCWQPEAIELFRRMSYTLWDKTNGNPRILLRSVGQDRLEELAQDAGFLSHLEKVAALYEEQIEKSKTPLNDRKVAYFSLEYGIHESIALYSGGLGILAGDHLKSSSDMDLPLVAVGLLYRQGYFHQSIGEDGWQNEIYTENNIDELPIQRAVDENGNDVVIHLRLLDEDVKVIVWRMDIGKVPLFLLDTELPENSEQMRRVTWRLYGGDRQMRLRQELLLGIGGYEAILKAGCMPAVCHINEGHAAFLSLARISHLMKDFKIDLEAAVEIVWRTNIFTTHTPVPAGNEVFNIDLLRPHLEALGEELGIDIERVLRWGVPQDSHDYHEFSMTILGLRMSHYNNGVSRLHGEVARSMWSHLWPEIPEDETPITHITNGIHLGSWVWANKKDIYDKYLTPEWTNNPMGSFLPEHIELIPAVELWQTHETARARLVRHTREKLISHLKANKAQYSRINEARNVLDPNILTIGFARRFATYKRATLLLNDKERLLKLLRDESMPVQFVFAGKAHPADETGKQLIKEIIDFARENNVSHRMVMIEDYDIKVGRLMTQGVDVWLNNPRRPEEASGTSGMKAAANGVLNFSILDGWWDEGYRPECGWVIDSQQDIADHFYRDKLEAQSLYNVLENEIIPCFYDRRGGNMPERWVTMMKESLKMGIGEFSSHRMVKSYNDKFYEPAIKSFEKLETNSAALAKTLAAKKQLYRDKLSEIKVSYPTAVSKPEKLYVGDDVEVLVDVELGSIKPEDITIEIYYGPVNNRHNVIVSNTKPMRIKKDHGGGKYTYTVNLSCEKSGRFGVTARAVPSGAEWKNCMPGFIVWASQ